MSDRTSHDINRQPYAVGDRTASFAGKRGRRGSKSTRLAQVASRYSVIAILAISCAALAAWSLHGERADADLALEVRELEQFVLDLCGFGRAFSAVDPDDQFFLERARSCYAAMLKISRRHEVDELTVARGHLRMGMILVACGQGVEAVEPLRTAWNTLQHFDRFPLLEEHDKAPDAQELAADCAAHLAAVLATAQQETEAEELFAVALKHYETESQRKSGRIRIAINFAGTGKAYGDMLMSQRRWRDAERTYLRAQHTCEKLLRDPEHPRVVDLLAAQLKENRAKALERLGNVT